MKRECLIILTLLSCFSVRGQQYVEFRDLDISNSRRFELIIVCDSSSWKYISQKENPSFAPFTHRFFTNSNAYQILISALSKCDKPNQFPAVKEYPLGASVITYILNGRKEYCFFSTSNATKTFLDSLVKKLVLLDNNDNTGLISIIKNFENRINKKR